MTQLIIGILCCLVMAGTLFAYLEITKRKYYAAKTRKLNRI